MYHNIESLNLFYVPLQKQIYFKLSKSGIYILHESIFSFSLKMCLANGEIYMEKMESFY